MIYYIKYSCTIREIEMDFKLTYLLTDTLTYMQSLHIVRTGYNPVNIKLGLQFRKCTNVPFTCQFPYLRISSTSTEAFTNLSTKEIQRVIKNVRLQTAKRDLHFYPPHTHKKLFEVGKPITFNTKIANLVTTIMKKSHFYIVGN